MEFTRPNNSFETLKALGGIGGIGSSSIKKIPLVNFLGFSLKYFVNYLLDVMLGFGDEKVKVDNSHTPPSALVDYIGAVLSPIQNRVYFIPHGNTNTVNWTYYDNKIKQYVDYAHGTGITISDVFFGGVYSPTQNRIYLVPYKQAALSSLWYYIDCSTGNIQSYTHGTTFILPVSGLYAGGVYSPTQNRIYFVPYEALSGSWHYVDCALGNIVSYSYGSTPLVLNSYIGGVYSPTQNRIYFVPYGMSNQSMWHYIDCSSGNPVTYTHGISAVQYAYSGGVYSPLQNRIYFVPYAQANQTKWHYIDCSTGNVVAYTHGATTVTNAYRGGVFFPQQNRIYFVPFAQSDQSLWHYIDCSTGNIIAYAHNVSIAPQAYHGGVFDPNINKIRLIPNVSTTTPHLIEDVDSDFMPKISINLMSGPLFNKL